jgi:intermediate cleaving peptidase 55
LYPHHVGHYVGLDVHDTASISRGRKLLSGTAITIGILNSLLTLEPGLYVPNSDRYPEKYRGIGIRIEDNIIIGGSKTPGNAPIVLTAEAPKEVEDVEGAVNGVLTEYQ